MRRDLSTVRKLEDIKQWLGTKPKSTVQESNKTKIKQIKEWLDERKKEKKARNEELYVLAEPDNQYNKSEDAVGGLLHMHNNTGQLDTRKRETKQSLAGRLKHFKKTGKQQEFEDSDSDAEIIVSCISENRKKRNCPHNSKHQVEGAEKFVRPPSPSSTSLSI
jgi:hypothetical protein